MDTVFGEAMAASLGEEKLQCSHGCVPVLEGVRRGVLGFWQSGSMCIRGTHGGSGF